MSNKDNTFISILHIEDNDLDARVTEKKISEAFTHQFNFSQASNLKKAQKILKKESFDFIILDLFLPDSKGIETLKSVLKAAPETPMIVHSGENDPELALEAVKLGAQDYLVKGLGDANTLKRVMEHSIERKRAIARIQQNEQLFRTFIVHTPAAVAIFDEKMSYIMASERWIKSFKLQNTSIDGKNLYKTTPTISQEWKKCAKECLKGKVKKSDEDTLIQEDGQTEYIKWEMHPWYYENKEIGGIILFCEFITDRILIQQTLKEYNETLEEQVAERTKELEEANQAKTEFFALITHELRTPLHAIINFSKFGIEKIDHVEPKKLTRYFQNILKSGERLLWLVDDILDLSKAQTSNLDLHIKANSIERVINDTVEQLQSILETEDFRIKASKELRESEGELKVKIINKTKHKKAYFDKDRITQVLTNLISNAIKFSDKDAHFEIILKDDKTKPATKKSREAVSIAVKDQGIGIPESELESIFDEFAQSTKIRSGQFNQGTGLGLAICREIIHAHNGQIWAENNPDKGSTITFTLPVHETDVKTS